MFDSTKIKLNFKKIQAIVYEDYFIKHCWEQNVKNIYLFSVYLTNANYQKSFLKLIFYSYQVD